jgi:hypothetical protein
MREEVPMNPVKHLYVAILDALKEFPGLEKVTFLTDKEGIEVRIYHGGRAAARLFSVRDYATWPVPPLVDLLVKLIGDMVLSVNARKPGRGAAWSEKFPT